MTKFLRMTCLAASVAATALTATPAVAAPVGASTPATARARIVRPLTLTATRNLDFGTITLGTVAAGGETVSMTQAGVVTCGTGGLTCSGAPVSAQYNVQGTNNQVVQIFAVASPLTNANDASTLSFTPNAPATTTLTNSGAPVSAQYNVQGTNNQVVQIFAVASPLTNANDASTLSFTPNAPATTTLTNSGAPGTNFNVGGSIVITPTTTDGVYSGNINVTVDYQ